eukprot:1161302-Pelagomonas_calceolata.AAC.1
MVLIQRTACVQSSQCINSSTTQRRGNLSTDSKVSMRAVITIHQSQMRGVLSTGSKGNMRAVITIYRSQRRGILSRQTSLIQRTACVQRSQCIDLSITEAGNAEQTDITTMIAAEGAPHGALRGSHCYDFWVTSLHKLAWCPLNQCDLSDTTACSPAKFCPVSN